MAQSAEKGAHGDKWLSNSRLIWSKLLGWGQGGGKLGEQVFASRQSLRLAFRGLAPPAAASKKTGQHVPIAVPSAAAIIQAHVKPLWPPALHCAGLRGQTSPLYGLSACSRPLVVRKERLERVLCKSKSASVVYGLTCDSASQTQLHLAKNFNFPIPVPCSWGPSCCQTLSSPIERCQNPLLCGEEWRVEWAACAS